MNSSFELYEALKKLPYHVRNDNKYWWPESGSFEVVVGAILTQQTKWENVEKSLDMIRESIGISVEAIVDIDVQALANLIKPSGFYNKKAKNIKLISQAIKEEFGDFEQFQSEVTREWLLAQKGVGFESADSILCYGCYHEVMVVDSYTDRILRAFGYEFESYDEIQEWMMSGFEGSGCEFFALYHGMIVEYAKRYVRGRSVDVSVLRK